MYQGHVRLTTSALPPSFLTTQSSNRRGVPLPSAANANHGVPEKHSVGATTGWLEWRVMTGDAVISPAGRVQMMRTNRESGPMLIALALVAGLAMYAGLVRGPIEEVPAQGLRLLTVGHGTLVLRAGVAVVHERPLARVINITASNFKFVPQQIRLTRRQPVTLRLTSIDRTHSFVVRALNIDTYISPGTTTEVTVTPQVEGTFKAIGDHYAGAGPGYMKMMVVVQ
jgi:hypothetical protein